MHSKIENGEYSQEQGNELLDSQSGTESTNTGNPPPKFVIGNDYFWQCVEDLNSLLEDELLPKVVVESTEDLLLIYGYVDALGSGFGESLLIKGKVHYQIGTWGKDKENSSNW